MQSTGKCFVMCQAALQGSATCQNQETEWRSICLIYEGGIFFFFYQNSVTQYKLACDQAN